MIEFFDGVRVWIEIAAIPIDIIVAQEAILHGMTTTSKILNLYQVVGVRHFALALLNFHSAGCN